MKKCEPLHEKILNNTKAVMKKKELSQIFVFFQIIDLIDSKKIKLSGLPLCPVLIIYQKECIAKRTLYSGPREEGQGGHTCLIDFCIIALEARPHAYTQKRARARAPAQFIENLG